MKKLIALIAVVILGAFAANAMDAIRIAGTSSSTNLKNTTLDLTIRVYDPSNTQIYQMDVENVYFDWQSVFSFVVEPELLVYNPLFNVKIENSLNSVIVFESRLDKIVQAQSQLGAVIDPDEINTWDPFYFHEVIVENNVASAGIRKANDQQMGYYSNDVFYVYDNEGSQTFGVNPHGDVRIEGQLEVSGVANMIATTFNGPITANDNVTFYEPVTANNVVTFNAQAKFNKELVSDIQVYSGGASVVPTTAILNIGTLTNDVTLADGYAGQILYVVGNTNGWLLSGASFSRGATYVCTATDVWVCVGKN